MKNLFVFKNRCCAFPVFRPGNFVLICCSLLGLLLGSLSAQPLSGIYTIGGATPNYTNFSAAFSALNSNGVSGPVTFMVRPGTYTERAVLNQVNGASSINNIRFIGSGKGVTILTNTATSNSNSITLRLDGSDHISFRDMDIESLGLNYGMAILLGNKADSNSFKNIRVITNIGSTNTRTGCIVFSSSTSVATGTGNNGNYNTFDSLELTGSYFGIAFTGQGATTPIYGNRVLNCTMRDQLYYGIYSSSGHNGFEFSRNTIRMRTVTTTGTAIFNKDGTNFIIENNYLYSNIGIDNNECNKYLYNPSFQSRITNNMLVGAGNANALFLLFSSDYVQVAHNSIAGISGSSYSQVAFFNNNNGIDCRNNIFASYNNIAGKKSFVNNNGSFFSYLDANVYYSSGPDLAQHNNVNFTSLSAWKQANPDINQRSDSSNPVFLATDNLHLSPSSPNIYGIYMNVTRDFDGQYRTRTPFIGADEKEKSQNNAGINRLVSPSDAFCTGSTQTIKAEITNDGSNKLDSVRIYWEVDGVWQTPVYVNSPIDTIGGPGNGLTEVTLGTVAFAANTAKKIKIWTSNPNGATDPSGINDTLLRVLKPALNGTYTIGHTGADFLSFTEAAENLNSFGVCGPVTFYVSADTFNERLLLKAIQGTSPTNTIQFLGAGKGKTILTNNALSVGSMATVWLEGSDYVTLRDMTIGSSNINQGMGILLTQKADYNRFQNLHIRLNLNSTANNTVGVAAIGMSNNLNSQGDATNYSLFDSLEISGGYSGIIFKGAGTGNFMDNNIITNCHIYKQWFEGINIQYQDQPVISRNQVNDIRAYGGWGISNVDASNFRMEANNIKSSNGINCTNSNKQFYNPLLKTSIINNMVQSSATFGLYITNSDTVQVLHNSVSTATPYSVFLENNRHTDCRNNLFVNSATGPNRYALYYSNVGFSAFDFNNYYTSATDLVSANGTVYSNLPAWQSAITLWNQNSSSLDPGFTGAGSLYLVAGGVNTAYGTSAGVSTDIDGRTRSASAPICGAHEKPIYSNSSGIRKIVSPKFFCGGTQTLTVEIVNAGTRVLDSLRIYWEIDGVAQPTLYPAGLALPVQSATVLTLGSVSFPSPSGKSLKIWTSHPNGYVDSLLSDDTLHETLKPALNGNYTIGGTGADFADFSSVATELNKYGVCGPVVFTVAPGIYRERMVLKAVKGTSFINTVEFTGAGIGQTILTSASGGGDDLATLLLDSVKHFFFRHMTVASTDLDYGVGILLTNFSDSNTFTGMRIQMNTASVNDRTAGFAFSGLPNILSPGSSGDYVVLDSLEIDGGYQGLFMSGNPGNNHTQYGRGNVIRNCRFTNQFTFALRAEYQTGFHIHHNYIEVKLRGIVDPYAMHIYYCNSFTIEANKISSQGWGISIQYSNNYNHNPNEKTLVFNNMINLGSPGRGFNSGMELDNCRKVSIWHNSIHQYSGASYALVIKTSSNLDCRNNIFANSRTQGNSPVYLDNVSTFDYLDYNVYYHRNGRYLVYGNTLSCFDLGCWKAISAYSQFNAHSLEFVGLNTDYIGVDRFYFQTMTDMHLAKNAPEMPGIYLGVNTDIDGETRCELSVTIGADQLVEPSLFPNIRFVVQDTLFEKSPGTVLNTTVIYVDEPVKYTWSVNGAEVSNEKDLRYTFPNTGVYTVKLKAQTCSGSDSLSTLVTVYAPASVPVADFTATHLVILPGEVTRMIDLSMHGPTDWEWSARPHNSPSPNMVLFEPNEFSDAPGLIFLEPGYYDICLKSGNTLGKSQQVCKPGYIFVTDDATMGFNHGSAMEGGKIKSNLAQNDPGKSSFLISPDSCVSQILLEISSFNIFNPGDSLIVYDGENNQAPVLGSYHINNPAPRGTILTAGSRNMFLEWITIGYVSGIDKPFFEAQWSSIKDSTSGISGVDFEYPQAIYTGQVIDFTGKVSSSGIFTWDFDYPNKQGGLNTGYLKNNSYKWHNAGTYTVALHVESCVGKDSTSKQIQVMNPLTAPVAGFYASHLKIPPYTRIDLIDTSLEGPSAWLWAIEPPTGFTFESPVNSRNPQVRFYSPGMYMVKLRVTNDLGSDSISKVGYIEVLDHCMPVAPKQNNDIGISRVQLGNINNITPIGQSAYTNYCPVFEPVKVMRSDSFEFSMERPQALTAMDRNVWIDWNRDGDFDDAGETIFHEISSFNKTFKTFIHVPASAVNGYTVLRAGSGSSTGTLGPCSAGQLGEFEDYPLEITTPQSRKPELILIGSETDSIRVFQSYSDPGAVAFDFLGQDITYSIQRTGVLDSSKLGVYTYLFIVSDADGKKDSAQRQIKVYDDIAPVLTYPGQDTITMDVKGFINDDGILATDNYYTAVTDISIDSSKVNRYVTGIYPITYTAFDSSGNAAQLTKWVKVTDRTAPLIRLSGSDTIEMEVHTSYFEMGAIVSDNYCPGVIYLVTGNVDTSRTGNYILTYNAQDCEGNTATAQKRVVKVVDRTAPLISLVGTELVYLSRWEAYNDSGYVLNDNYSDSVNVQIEIMSNWQNSSEEGLFHIRYKATDESGNIGYSAMRIIDVRGTNSLVKTNAEANRLFPNPNNGNFTVELGGAGTAKTVLQIFDISGKLVYTTHTDGGSNLSNINVQHLVPGTYLVRVEQQTIKMIIVH